MPGVAAETCDALFERYDEHGEGGVERADFVARLMRLDRLERREQAATRPAMVVGGGARLDGFQTAANRDAVKGYRPVRLGEKWEIS